MSQSSSKALHWLASFGYQTDQGQLFKLTTKIKDKYLKVFSMNANQSHLKKIMFQVSSFNQLATYNVGSFHIQRTSSKHCKIWTFVRVCVAKYSISIGTIIN